MLNSEDLTNAMEKKYTAFSTAVKQELANKLQAHPVIQSHVAEFDRINQLKDLFAQINNTKRAPEVEVPDE